MTHVRVALVTLILVGCAAKPPVPPSTTSEPAPTSPAPPPAAAPAAPAPAPQRPAPPPAPPPSPAPAAPSAQPALRPPPPAPAPPPVAQPVAKVLYVKTHLANFREGGGTGMKILRVLRQGTRLKVLEERSEWLRVRLDDGQEGWVAASVTAPTAP